MLWVAKPLSGKSSERVHQAFLEDYHDSRQQVFYRRHWGAALYCLRIGVVEDQDRVNLRPFAKAENSGNLASRSAGLAPGAGQGQKTLRLGCRYARAELLRSGPRWLLVAPLADDARDREPGRRSRQLEGESTAQTSQDGSDRRSAVVGASAGLQRRQETCLERGACAEPGTGRASAIASRDGDLAG